MLRVEEARHNQSRTEGRRKRRFVFSGTAHAGPNRPRGRSGWIIAASQRAILEQLREENRGLRARVAELEQTIRELLDRNRELLDQNRLLREKLDEQARAAARQ